MISSTKKGHSVKGKLARVIVHHASMWGYPDCASRYDKSLNDGELLLIMGNLDATPSRLLVYSQRFGKKGTVEKRNVEVL